MMLIYIHGLRRLAYSKGMIQKSKSPCMQGYMRGVTHNRIVVVKTSALLQSLVELRVLTPVHQSC